MSEGPRCRPALLGDSRWGPRSRGVDQMSRASRAMVRGPAWSTSSPGRLELGSEVPQGSPAFPGDSRSGRWPTLSTSSPGRLGPMPEGLRARPDVPADLGPCSSACGVDQLSRATRARVRWSAGSTSCPSLLGPCSEGPRCRPALPGDLRPAPITREVSQLSQATCARVRGPVGLTSSPRRLRLLSDGPSVEQLSQRTRAQL